MDGHETHDEDAASAQDRRQWTRVPTALEARVESAGSVIRGRVRDLSLTGVYVLCAPRFPEGVPCRVTLVLMGAEPPLTVELAGRVAHAEDDGMGIELTEMPVTSVDHVRNLIVDHSQDPDRVEEDLPRSSDS
jgi:hypothetical protein